MADFKLGMADLKLVSYPKGLKSIKSKLGWLSFSEVWLTLLVIHGKQQRKQHQMLYFVFNRLQIRFFRIEHYL